MISDGISGSPFKLYKIFFLWGMPLPCIQKAPCLFKSLTSKGDVFYWSKSWNKHISSYVTRCNNRKVTSLAPEIIISVLNCLWTRSFPVYKQLYLICIINIYKYDFKKSIPHFQYTESSMLHLTQQNTTLSHEKLQTKQFGDLVDFKTTE